MQALVLAAGYGTRMGLTDKPKHLLEIKPGVPIIELVIKNIAQSKYINNVYLITNRIFYSFFEQWLAKSSIEKPVFLINNQTNSNEDRCGSVGDILYGLEEIRKKEEIGIGLLVAQGDDLVYDLPINKMILEYKRKRSALIITHRARVEELAERFGVVEVNENKKFISVKEKPKLGEIRIEDGTALANGGYYIFTKSDLSSIVRYKRETIGTERKPLDRTGNLFSWMVAQGIPLFAYEHPREYWWDIGKPKDLEAARTFYQNL